MGSGRVQASGPLRAFDDDRAGAPNPDHLRRWTLSAAKPKSPPPQLAIQTTALELAGPLARLTFQATPYNMDAPYWQGSRFNGIVENMAMQRTVRVQTVLGETLLFRAMVGREAISEPYEYQLTLVSDDDSVAFADLLGTDMTVEIDVLGDDQRHFHGLVSRFASSATRATSPATRRCSDRGCGSCPARPTAASSRR